MYGKVTPETPAQTELRPTSRRARYRYDPTLRLLSWQFFTLGLGKIFELFFGHRLGHLLRRAFEGGFTGFAALG